jgi:hypothetical protein
MATARINEIDERKRIELAKIDNLEMEYWNAWKRSCEKATTETTRLQGHPAITVDGGQPAAPKTDKLEKISRVEDQAGEPKFLAGVAWCINKRCEILGLDYQKPPKLFDQEGVKEVTVKVVYEQKEPAD